MITKKEVAHLAKLARLGLTEKEMEEIQKDLSLILDYFNLLKEVNTEGVEPTSHPISAKPSSEISLPRRENSLLWGLLLGKPYLRKDEVLKQSPEKIQKLIEMAPQKEKGYLKVKSIL